MKIQEFTLEEQQFLFGNLSQMTVAGGHPNIVEISLLMSSCIGKLKHALGVVEKMPQPQSKTEAKKPLASAARSSRKR